jgi:hypothetical protein
MTYEYQSISPYSGLRGMGVDRVSAPNRVSPYPRVTTTVSGITAVCYQGMSRTDINPAALPYSIEVNPIGTTLICQCNVRPAVVSCPQEVHQGANAADPWRREKCNQWVEEKVLENTELLSTEAFREQLAKQAMDLVGVPGWRRWFAGPAEFTTVLREKEDRARPIKIVAPMILLASGGYLFWRYATSKGWLKSKKKTEPVVLETSSAGQTAQIAQ